MRSEIYLILCDKIDFSYFKNNSRGSRNGTLGQYWVQAPYKT